MRGSADGNGGGAERAAPAPERGAGSGAVLGVRVMRYSGVQAITVGVASLLQLVTLFVIAHYLGAAQLGRYAVLFFATGLIAHMLTIVCKPGTIRRTFGASDDEGDDDEDDDEVSASPRRSLGTGLALALLIAMIGTAAGIALREPIAEFVLGGAQHANVVFWAAILGGATVAFRLASLVIWFERRPNAFVVAEITRPVLSLGVMIAMFAAGAGLEAAFAGAAVGTALAAAVAFVLLRGSFDLAFDLGEVREILVVGRRRAPILTSFWAMGNADVLVLSPFVGDADLGIYTLASRIGFLGAFAPQAFRLGLRPLRKAAIFQAVEEQYGRAEQRGQLLGYFVLVCISALLAMVLISRTVVDFAPSDFADAAPLIPLAAAGMFGPPLLRTVNQQTSWPGRGRHTFVFAAVGGMLLFFAITLALAGPIGVYAAPACMIGGIAVPCAYVFLRCQRSSERISYPYGETGRAVLLAAAIGGAYALLPEQPVLIEAAIAVALAALYLALLAFRVIPTRHRTALLRMGRSLVSGRPDQFNPRRGLRALEPGLRDELRRLVASSWAGDGAGDGAGGGIPDPNDAERMVKALRTVGVEGGMPVRTATDLDARIARFVFTDEPTALRNATMRRLLAEGAEAGDLRALEDLVTHLARVPDDEWAGLRKDRSREAGAVRRA